MNRRSFFSRIARAAAIVAMAPQIAFGVFPKRRYWHDEQLQEQPRLINIDDNCGCSLTRASIRALTPAAFENMGVAEEAFRADHSGPHRKTLKDLLLSKNASFP